MKAEEEEVKRKRIDDAIIQIKGNDTITPADILSATPFEDDKDLNGLLTNELFFEKLFYENNVFKSAKAKLRKALTHADWTNRIVFYYGFSGVGKTTFLRSFINDSKEDFKHIYFDVHRHVKQNEGSKLNNEHALAVCFSNYFDSIAGESDLNLKVFYHYMKEKSSLLRAHMGLKRIIESLPKYYDESKFLDALYSMNLDQILYLFFIYLFKFHEDKKCRVIYFDNLDALEIEYISTQFQRNFPIYLKNVNEIARNPRFGFQKNLDFIHKFKFVFCLRDANYSQVQASSTHQQDNIWSVILSDNLQLSFDNNLYKAIIRKRLEFIVEVIPRKRLTDTVFLNKDIASFFNDIVVKDETFENITLPLYNYDNRKLIINLYQVAQDTLVIDKDFKSFYEEHPFGARGSIIFGLLKLNFSNNFLKKFLNNKIPQTTPNGYCDPRRMVLTMLSNVGNYNTYNHTMEAWAGKEVDFFDFVLDMGRVYSIHTIIKVLTELYLDYQNSWTHLITIVNKEIISKDSFELELNNLEELRKLNKKRNPRESDSKRMREIKESLNNIKIRINPSAFSFLRHLAIHFEYFSIIGGNTEPLFKPLGLVQDHEEFKYNFEGKIDLTILTLERYSFLIRKFYGKIIRSELKMEPEDYVASDFCFKFFGDDEIGKKIGMFYTMRVITAHFSYIKAFRCWLLQKLKKSPELSQDVNSRLITQLERYIKLLESDPDPQAKSFKEKFSNSIKEMKEFNGNDLDDCIDSR